MVVIGTDERGSALPEPVLTREQARSKVLAELHRFSGDWTGPMELLIVDERTIERPWGWVFFYTTRGRRDGDMRYALGGNAPYIVNRFTGEIRVTGTARPIDDYVEQYEAALQILHGSVPNSQVH
jgi:hypothetical protein